MISDESGTIVSEMKYTAFGEIRDINGTSPTDYKSKRCFDFKAIPTRNRSYTGQRKEVEFGLSFYNSRWYDAEPMLSIGLREFASQILQDENKRFSSGHFTSADTLDTESKQSFDLRRIYFVNSPIAACCVGDSGAWDRYAYVLNNPINFNDPTGRYTIDRQRDDTPLIDGDPSFWTDYQNEVQSLRNEITTRWGGNVSDISHLNLINTQEAGNQIAAYVNSVDSSINGDYWIRNNLGSAVFKENANAFCQGNNCVFLLNTIWLNDGNVHFSTVIHELGHVWDNHLGGGALPIWFGGGPSDDLLTDVYGISVNDALLRWGNNYHATNPRQNTWPFRDLVKSGAAISRLKNGNVDYHIYGNYGIADYYADSFMYLVVNYSTHTVPSQTKQFIDDLIVANK